jgi:hypothetical protein
VSDTPDAPSTQEEPETVSAAEAGPEDHASAVVIPDVLPELPTMGSESTTRETTDEAPLLPPVEAVDKSEFEARYQDLLKKVTAAEIFAAEQQALSPPGTQHQLMPILKSLKDDLLKIHAAA